jgi:hypothetical protein
LLRGRVPRKKVTLRHSREIGALHPRGPFIIIEKHEVGTTDFSPRTLVAARQTRKRRLNCQPYGGAKLLHLAFHFFRKGARFLRSFENIFPAWVARQRLCHRGHLQRRETGPKVVKVDQIGLTV